MIDIKELGLNRKNLECKKNICSAAISLYELYRNNLSLRFKGIKNRKLHISYNQTVSLSRRHLNQMIWNFDLYHGE